jgi:hypothetical protein
MMLENVILCMPDNDAIAEAINKTVKEREVRGFKLVFHQLHTPVLSYQAGPGCPARSSVLFTADLWFVQKIRKQGQKQGNALTAPTSGSDVSPKEGQNE